MQKRAQVSATDDEQAHDEEKRTGGYISTAPWFIIPTRSITRRMRSSLLLALSFLDLFRNPQAATLHIGPSHDSCYFSSR
ncbi:hypothetical protein OUZ56_028799 [Daphnia magna]|uniref:Uncharacterized protein n=1 Tax=Daphnia magna TaxID=35525 RepID=A0ABR0B4Z7_9CRUS|nr:hypothetical protein OUZ56_028799 [Daphnia magna]